MNRLGRGLGWLINAIGIALGLVGLALLALVMVMVRFFQILD